MEKIKEFDELPAFKKVRAIGALARHEEDFKKLDPIYSNFSITHGFIIEIINVNDEYQFAKYENRNKEICYAIYLNFKPIHHHVDSLDAAILKVLAHKYYGSNSQAGILMATMLGVK